MDDRVSRLQQALLDWYTRSARVLPWRETRDPYWVLVAEVMLQQTQVSRVLPKYAEFLTRFPTFEALAACDPADVIRAWAPLGYNLRALRLHRVAREAVARGSLPTDVKALQQLPGLGRYTAAALACFSFGQAVPVLDTNVRRVLSRALLGEVDPRGVPAERLWSLAEQALPRDRAYDWNQALMDLGATICVSRQPSCERCPLSTLCRARPLLRSSPRPSRPRRVAERRSSYRVAEQPRRYWRGRLVDLLRDLPKGGSISVAAAAAALRPGSDPHWVWSLARDLARDGLVEIVAQPHASLGPDPSSALLGLPGEQAAPSATT